MQNHSLKPHPPIFDSADKLLRFGVSDTGEFIDSIYREQQSSKLFGKIIGRQTVNIHGKGVFSTADIVCEGYLFKKGSWVQNWKKRYFILRRDIRALCYYSSREDLTLLGSIPLDLDTILTNVKPDQADGYPNVIAIETETCEGPMRTFVRFETFEKMKAWMLDIKNEAQNLTATTDELFEWWDSLFASTELIEPKNTVPRRDGVMQQKAETTDSAPPQSSSDKAETTMHTTVDSDDDSDEEAKPSTKEGVSDIKESKRRSLNNNMVVMNGASRIEKKIKPMKADKKPPGPPPFEHPLADQYETPQGALSSLQFSLRLSNICAYQDRLFVVLFVSNLTEQSSSLAHAANVVQGTSTNTPSAMNTSAAQPSPLNSARGKRPSNSHTSFSTSRWTQLGRTEVRVVSERPAYSESYVSDVKIFFHALQPLIPEACKEIKLVVYRQEYNGAEGRSTDLSQQMEIARTIIPRKLLDFKSVLQIKMRVRMHLPVDIAVPLFKDAEVTLGVVKLSSFALYQHRSWWNRTLKSTPYAETMYAFVMNSGIATSMEQLFASKYGASVAQAMLVLLSSERQEFLYERMRMLKEEFAGLVRHCGEHPPQSVVSSPTSTAMATAAQGQGAVSSASSTANTAPPSGAGAATGLPVGPPGGGVAAGPAALGDDEKLAALYEPYRSAIETINELYLESNELAAYIVTNLDNVTQGKALQNNVLSPEEGGGVLRRSVWKKMTAWQYCTTNLNVHLLTSKCIAFRDVSSQAEYAADASNSRGNTTVFPTITLGCPAAHELGFGEGGLRRLFLDIPTTERKLIWMQAIQCPSLELLGKLFHSHPKEASVLFGSKYSALSTNEEVAMVIKRKAEIARRLDICASQALGCAVTTVRVLTMLATNVGGTHFDALARALKTGFMVTFQSFLSTQGAELGMLEDLEMSALWLSLVTVRLVTHPSNSQRSSSVDLTELSERTMSTSLDSQAHTLSGGTAEAVAADPAPSPKTFRRKFSQDGKQIFSGYGDGVCMRRDVNGRLVVDIEITAQEATTVLDALNFMSQFAQRPTQVLPPSSSTPFAFSTQPAVSYSHSETAPRVYAVAELFGIVFTQGVNEMQTLANLSSSRDVLKQVDINQTSLGRLREFYAAYREALEFQLTKRMPEMVDSIWLASQAPATAEPSESICGSLSFFGAHPGHSLHSSPMSAAGVASGAARRRRNTYIAHATQHTDATQALSQKVEQLMVKILSYNDRLLDQLHETIIVATSNPYEKHVDVLLRSSTLCRQICGTIATLCKSGKDRTSMGVTLENTRSLVEDLGVFNGQDICQLMRAQGVRRMNVYANTGQSMFAFNQIQRRALPACFRPPPGSHAGNVTS